MNKIHTHMNNEELITAENLTIKCDYPKMYCGLEDLVWPFIPTAILVWLQLKNAEAKTTHTA